MTPKDYPQCSIMFGAAALLSFLQFNPQVQAEQIAVVDVNRQPLQPQQLAELVRPAVVRVDSGCSGKAYWFKTKKTYDLSVLGSGSGYFINSDGYIMTNAHVVELSQKPDQCKGLLLQEFAKQIAQEIGADPKTILNSPKALAAIAHNSGLREFQSVNRVQLSCSAFK